MINRQAASYLVIGAWPGAVVAEDQLWQTQKVMPLKLRQRQTGNDIDKTKARRD